MKGCAICVRGLENSTVNELTEFNIKKVDVFDGFVNFDVSSKDELANIAYNLATTSRVIEIITNINISKSLLKSNIETNLKNLDFSSVILKDKSFKVECVRVGKHDFKSGDMEEILGEIIIESIEKNGYKPKVKMDNPDISIFCQIIDETLVLGVDYCGFDTSKRDYHIFTNRYSIKGTTASALIYQNGSMDGKTILDPMGGSGTIMIELGLMNEGKSANAYKEDEFAYNKFGCKVKSRKKKDISIIFYDPLLANVKSTQKNAKIAGVDKQIKFGKAELEWLDTKMDEKSVDHIISRLPSPSPNNPQKTLEKQYKDLLYCAEYILSDKGIMTFLLLDKELLLDIVKAYAFKVKDIKEFYIGKQNAFMVMLERK